jgi:hypothetical protein
MYPPFEKTANPVNKFFRGSGLPEARTDGIILKPRIKYKGGLTAQNPLYSCTKNSDDTGGRTNRTVVTG